MTDIHAPEHERHGNARQAVHLVGRQAEVDRIRAFLAADRTNGAPLLVTGEPGVGKTELQQLRKDQS